MCFRLDNQLRLKICSYGILSAWYYDEEMRKNKGKNDRIRWLAPEAITEGRSSVKTEVVSGIDNDLIYNG